MVRPVADDVIAKYGDAKQQRTRHEPDWRIASAHCMPRHFSAWNTEGPALYGSSAAEARRVAYDSTGVRALTKYVAILERIATPHNIKWEVLTTTNPDLNKVRRVREYYDSLNKLLFSKRYAPRAGFIQGASEVYASMGVYGTGPIFVGQRTPNALSQDPSLLYKAFPLRDIFILLNDEGEVDTVFRRFWLNARQFMQKFPGEELPKAFRANAANGDKPQESAFQEFVHCVYPRSLSDYDPEAIDVRRHPIVASYICVADRAYVGEEKGYRSMPYLTPRTFTESGDPYGFAPALQALAAMGSASSMKKTNLKQGQKAVDPVILAHDDGVMNGPVDLRPGRVNYGGIDKQGRKLIDTLPTGDFRIAEKLLESEQNDINEAFFANIFKILMETPEMTATQVMDRVAKESALLSPTMGRIQSEFLGPKTRREIDVLQEMGMIATGDNAPGLKMPPELVEAKGEYDTVYTSPMAKGMYADEVAGFMRAVNTALEIANATQDMSYLNHFNFDVAIPEMADRMASPPGWMNDPAKKKMLDEAMAQQKKAETLMQNAAPIAGAMKTAASMQQEGANV